MEKDNWKHRSNNMKCKTCMWFVLKLKLPVPYIPIDPEELKAIRSGAVIKASSEPEVYKVGRCRRHAPTMNGYPVVYITDWCGDHKIDEEKI